MQKSMALRKNFYENSVKERGGRGNGGTRLLKKPGKTFMRGRGWISFVQVRLLTNLSDPFHQEIVRERLTK